MCFLTLTVVIFYTLINRLTFWLPFLALEFMDWQSVDLVTRHTELRNPLEKSPFYVLIETAGSNGVHDEEVCVMCLCLIFYAQLLNVIEIKWIS